MGQRGPKPVADKVLLVTTAYPIYDDFWALAKGGRRGVVESQHETETVVKVVNLPSEPDTLIALLEAETVEQIRAACRESAWMAKQPNSYLSHCLPRLARQFLDAKEDRHYPRSERTTSIPKKFWFLARALAGAMYGLSPRRSINLIGPGTPEEIFQGIGPFSYSVVLRPKKKRKQRRRK
jgi:hypothetical protein